MFLGGHCIDWLDSEVVIEVMSREVEVCGDVRADSVDNIGSVVVDSGVQLLCCASYLHLMQVMRYMILLDVHFNECRIL